MNALPILALACASPSEVESLFWVLLAVMVFGIALSYMAAMFFRKPEYEAFSVMELWQLGVSVFLMLSIFGVACFSAEVSSAIAGADTFTVAHSYLNSVIYGGNGFDGAFPTLAKLEMGKLFWQFWGGVYGKYGASAWGIQVPIFPGAIVLEKTFDFLVLFLSPFTASLIAQQLGLQIIKGLALNLILPVGVLLRILPPTRDAGSFLIASALGFYVVFPFTYVMHAQVMEALVLQQAGLFTCHSVFTGQLQTAPATPGGQPGSMQLEEQQELISTLSYNMLVNWDDIFWRPLCMLSFIILQSVFLPSLSMVLTVTFIKSVLKFFSQKLE